MSGKHDRHEDDIDDYLRYMVILLNMILQDKKTIWKDLITKNENSMGNAAFLTPLFSITSSHHWIKRNLIPISDGNILYQIL